MSPSNGTTHENGYAADEMIDQVYAYWPAATPAPQPLQEAAFSLTLRGTLGGQEALLTARGMTPEEFRRNLEAIKGLLDAPPAPVPAASPDGAPMCPVHQVRMQRHENAGGVWYSHYTDGKHCKGK